MPAYASKKLPNLCSSIQRVCLQPSLLQSWRFPAVLSAAMLCPVLLCAALLLLTPLEITDARALHQPSDAAQVRVEGGAESGGN